MAHIARVIESRTSVASMEMRAPWSVQGDFWAHSQRRISDRTQSEPERRSTKQVVQSILKTAPIEQDNSWSPRKERSFGISVMLSPPHTHTHTHTPTQLGNESRSSVHTHTHTCCSSPAAVLELLHIQPFLHFLLFSDTSATTLLEVCNSQSQAPSARKQNPTNETQRIFLTFTFAIERQTYPPKLLRFCFVMNMQATTAGHIYENMQIPEIVFRFRNPTDRKSNIRMSFIDCNCFCEDGRCNATFQKKLEHATEPLGLLSAIKPLEDDACTRWAMTLAQSWFKERPSGNLAKTKP